MVIALDVDGVLALTLKEVLRRANVDRGTDYTEDDITSWDAPDKLDLWPYFKAKDLYDYVLPDPSAQEVVSELYIISRVIFVTSAADGTEGFKYNWLNRYGLCLNKRNYVEANDKSLIRADALLDDYHGNLENFHGRRFLLDKKYNQGTPYERIFSLRHFLTEVKEWLCVTK